MNGIAGYRDVAANREGTYAFLARAYRVEVDRVFLDELKSIPLCAGEGAGEYAEGVELLAAYLGHLGFDPLKDLAVDYARVFLAAGIADGGAAFPFESVYTSPERLIMQDARDQVVALYRDHGLGKAESWNEPEDHIALELEFMAYLCRKGAEAADRGDGDAVEALVRDQLGFLRTHLLNWVPRFSDDIERYSDTDFYRAVGKITVGFLRLDEELLAGLLEEGE